LFKQNDPQRADVCRKERNTANKALSVKRGDQALGSAKQEGAFYAGDGTEQGASDSCRKVEYAKIHKDWHVEKWRNILWSDESKIVLFGGKGSRSYVLMSTTN